MSCLTTPGSILVVVEAVVPATVVPIVNTGHFELRGVIEAAGAQRRPVRRPLNSISCGDMRVGCEDGPVDQSLMCACTRLTAVQILV